MAADGLIKRRANLSKTDHCTVHCRTGVRREAENVRAGFGDVFPPLPVTLLGRVDGQTTQPGSVYGQRSGIGLAETPPMAEALTTSAKRVATPTGFERFD